MKKKSFSTASCKNLSIIFVFLCGFAPVLSGCYFTETEKYPGVVGFHDADSPFAQYAAKITGMASQGDTAVAVSHEGIIAFSGDSGLTWQEVAGADIVDNFVDGIHFNTVAAGGGYFFAGADDGRAAFSTDGKIWQVGVVGPMNPKNIRCAAIGKVLGKLVFVAAGDDGRIAHAVDSPRGPWRLADLSPFGQVDYYGEDVFAAAYGVIKGNGVFVVAGQNGKIAIMKDLSGKWYGGRAGTGETFRSLAFGNDRFVVAGDNGMVKHSSNPREYTWIAASNTGLGYRQALGMAFDTVAGLFVVYTGDTVVGYSEYSETWNAAHFDEMFPNGISAITCTAARIILGGADGSIAFSN